MLDFVDITQFIIEGIGVEVALSGCIVLVFTIVFILDMVLRGQPNVEEPYEFRIDPPPVYNDSDCPVCLDIIQLGVETNCGHLFCGRCMIELEYRRRRRKLIVCPLCRQSVQMLFKRFRDRPDANRQEIIQMIKAYNKYSNQHFPQNVWDSIRNMPVLLRHMVQTIMENGFEFDRLLVTVLVLLGVSLTYFLLPNDIFPELMFGAYGLIDDFLIFFYSLFYLSVFYRNFLVNNDET